MGNATALVTGASTDAGVVVARELSAAGFRVVGVMTGRLSRVIRSRHVSAVCVLPPADGPEFEPALVEAVRRVRPDVLLPLGTASVRAACRQREVLRGLTGLNVPAWGAFMAAYDRRTCAAECRGLGLAVPEEYTADEARRVLSAAAAAARGAGVALVVKPRWEVGGAQGVSYVATAEALGRAVSECTARYGDCLIQEYIPGGAEAMRTVLLLFGRDGQLAAAFTARKVRHWPPTGGITAVSVSTAERGLVDQVVRLLAKWRWEGPAEVELKLDARDGRYKVIEVNPRFAGYLRFPVRCGLNLPQLAARLAGGEEACAAADALPAYRVGARYADPWALARSAWADVRANAAGRAAAVTAALRDVRGAGWVVAEMLSDPLPVLGRIAVSGGERERGGRAGGRRRGTGA